MEGGWAYEQNRVIAAPKKTRLTVKTHYYWMNKLTTSSHERYQEGVGTEKGTQTSGPYAPLDITVKYLAKKLLQMRSLGRTSVTRTRAIACVLRCSYMDFKVLVINALDASCSLW